LDGVDESATGSLNFFLAPLRFAALSCSKRGARCARGASGGR
jgi:hypothetical protein